MIIWDKSIQHHINKNLFFLLPIDSTTIHLQEATSVTHFQPNHVWDSTLFPKGNYRNPTSEHTGAVIAPNSISLRYVSKLWKSMGFMYESHIERFALMSHV